MPPLTASVVAGFLQMNDAVRTLDARGMRCPMPLLKLKQALNGMVAGEVIEVRTTDAGSVRDFQAFLRQGGHELQLLEQGESEFFFRIRKAA
jgi:tRNA 2-thiouridine synthesizing protein A